MSAAVLHSTIISFERLDLTQRTLDTYLATVTLPYTLVVVDNGSQQDVQDWLVANAGDYEVLLLGKNMYPGFATNRGWERAPDGATLLQRCDNDFAFLPGWCDEVLERFQDRTLGQLGMRTDEEELNAATNVGGNCIIRRHLWDVSFRWDERPWSDLGSTTEDFYASRMVMEMGYRWDRVQRPCIEALASGDTEDPYYRRSYGVRGILEWMEQQQEAEA